METFYILLILFILWNIVAYWAVINKEKIQNLLGLSPKVVKHVKKPSKKITELSIKIVKQNPDLNLNGLHKKLNDLGYVIEQRTAAQLFYHAKDSVSQSFYRK